MEPVRKDSQKIVMTHLIALQVSLEYLHFHVSTAKFGGLDSQLQNCSYQAVLSKVDQVCQKRLVTDQAEATKGYTKLWPVI